MQDIAQVQVTRRHSIYRLKLPQAELNAPTALLLPVLVQVQHHVAVALGHQAHAPRHLLIGFGLAAASNLVRGYQANGLNQYERTVVNGALAASFQYDGNGNLTSDGSTAFVYDSTR